MWHLLVADRASLLRCSSCFPAVERLGRRAGAAAAFLDPAQQSAVEAVVALREDRVVRRRVPKDGYGAAMRGDRLARLRRAGGEEAGRRRPHPVETESGVSAGDGVEQERRPLAQRRSVAAGDTAREPAQRRGIAANTEQVDIVGQRDKKALAARIATPLDA